MINYTVAVLAHFTVTAHNARDAEEKVKSALLPELWDADRPGIVPQALLITAPVIAEVALGHELPRA